MMNLHDNCKIRKLNEVSSINFSAKVGMTLSCSMNFADTYIYIYIYIV